MCAAVLAVGLVNAAFDVALYEKFRTTFDPDGQGVMFIGEDGRLMQPPYVYFPLPRPEKADDQDSGNKLSTPSRPA